METQLEQARRTLGEIRDLLDDHDVSIATELAYIERAVSVGMLEVDQHIRNESPEDAREYAREVKGDILGHLRRVRERAETEAQ